MNNYGYKAEKRTKDSPHNRENIKKGPEETPNLLFNCNVIWLKSNKYQSIYRIKQLNIQYR